MKLKPIDQQVVVVFGASSGIGRAAALQFAARGAKVIASARSASGLKSLVDEIGRNGGNAIAMVADAADFEQVKAVADRAIMEHGQLDTWVHLAAVSIYAPFEQITPAEFKRVIDVNLMGQVYGAMAALPYLKREGRGALIHISSVGGKRALPLQSPYIASKHGVNGFTEVLRLELQHDGLPISVTTIMPSSINTPFFNKARTKLGVQPRGLPPIYQPDIVVEAILHAAEYPTREIAVGGAAKLLIWGEFLSPKLVDAYLLADGFTKQRTNKPKSSEAPHNLFTPIEGYNRVKGDFDNEALSTSLYTWLEVNQGIMSALTGLALGATAALAVRTLRNGSS